MKEAEVSGLLKTLKLGPATPAVNAADPLSRARGRLLEQLAEQRELATAGLEGRIYQPPKRIALRTNADGERIRTEVARRVRKNFYQDQAGAYQFVMRIGLGAKFLELQPGKPAINVGTLDKLPILIDSLIAAVRAGELDPMLMDALAAQGVMMAKRRSKAA
ncbi:hypothetical protein MPPM_0085 [Methylorubrum populi]|jgi:hypothetical protein|uniref:Uncharacterized protein n=1 Tax=Methylorubrum populi TaxID=223967 RepID=A0A160PC36_9HYPH|nr:hypothetical protein MPPM_0085 [Methylorubrum populi]